MNIIKYKYLLDVVKIKVGNYKTLLWNHKY